MLNMKPSAPEIDANKIEFLGLNLERRLAYKINRVTIPNLADQRDNGINQAILNNWKIRYY